jgi:hypothetical protein
MGYKAAIDAMTYLLASFHFAKRAYQEIKRTGGYTGLTSKQCVDARQQIETLVGLDEFLRHRGADGREEEMGQSASARGRPRPRSPPSSRESPARCTPISVLAGRAAPKNSLRTGLILLRSFTSSR